MSPGCAATSVSTGSPSKSLRTANKSAYRTINAKIAEESKDDDKSYLAQDPAQLCGRNKTEIKDKIKFLVAKEGQDDDSYDSEEAVDEIREDLTIGLGYNRVQELA